MSAQDSGNATRLEWDVLENRGPGIVVGNLKEHFPRCSSFELIEPRSTDGFSLNPETGEVTLTRTGVLNHEKSKAATLYIQTRETLVEDQDPYAAQFSASLLEEGVSADRLKELTYRTETVRISINVLDAPEAPVVRESKFTVTENAVSGTRIGTVEATDGDRRESLRYNIVSGNIGEMFTIDAATGILRVSEGRQPDFEKSFLFDLVISVSDKDDLVGFGHCFVQVINLNETPMPVPKPTTKEPAFAQTAESGLESPPLTSGTGTPATRDAVSKTPVRGDDSASGNAGPNPPAGTVATRPVEPTAEKARPWSGRKFIPAPPKDTSEASIALAVENEPSAGVSESDVPLPDRSSDRPSSVEEAAGWKPELALSASEHQSRNLGLEATDGQEGRIQTSSGASDVSLRSAPSSPTDVAAPKSGVQKAAWILLICVVPGLAAAGVVYWRQKKTAALAEETSEATETQNADDLAETPQELSLKVTDPADSPTHESEKPLKPASELIPDDEGPFDPESLLADEYFDPANNDDLLPAISNSSGHTLAGSGYDDIEESLRRNLSEIRRDLADYQSGFSPLGRETSAAPPFVTAELNRFDGPAIPVPAGILTSQSGSLSSAESDTDSGTTASLLQPSLNLAVMTAEPVQSAPPLPESADPGTTYILDKRSEAGLPTSGASALRSELAELFDLHSRSGIAQSSPAQRKSSDETVDESDDIPSEIKAEETHVATGTPSQLADEEHRDSVARYLDSLLQKKKPEEPVLDRRKSTSPHSGPERRTTENTKKPAKSFIESYLEQHGGKLPDSSDAAAPLKGAESPADKSRSMAAETEEVAASGPQIPRTPVDVSSIREHMTSFREVATRSVEQALASYQMKQVKGRLALRTMLIIALVFVTGLIYAGNAAGFMQFAALNYLMVLAILLALGELSLQIVAYWKTHRDMTSVARGDAERRAEELAESKHENAVSETD